VNHPQASCRREELLCQKKIAAARESKADQIKKAQEDAAAKLKAETERKVEEALARANAHKASMSAKGAKMGKVNIDAFREEEQASIAFTKEMNEKRHKEALERAEMVSVPRSVSLVVDMVPTVPCSFLQGEKGTILSWRSNGCIEGR
jgi:regulator of protease activity HflC (stomatin/prohibitin superfamily)